MCKRCLAFSALLLFAIGCTPDFQEVWDVTDLRVLAVQADPPEHLFAAGLPATLPPVTLTALVVDPRDPDDEHDWEFWACTPEETRCELARQNWKLHAARTKLDEIRFDFTPSQEIFDASFEADPFRAFGGLPIMVEFRVLDKERDEYQLGIKRTVWTYPLLYSPIPPQKTANKNPLITEVAVDDKSPGADPLAVKTEQAVVLLPKPAADAKENYWVTEVEILPDGTQLPGLEFSEQEEFLSYQFFTTDGVLSHSDTGGPPNPFFENKKVTDITSEWMAPTEPADNVELWVVVRDGRGGVSWQKLRATVE
jgi:hypothetical protein